MSVGLWIVPGVMAGLGAFVWLATLLERLIPVVDSELGMTEVVDAALTNTSSHLGSGAIEGQPGAEFGRAVA